MCRWRRSCGCGHVRGVPGANPPCNTPVQVPISDVAAERLVSSVCLHAMDIPNPRIVACLSALDYSVVSVFGVTRTLTIPPNPGV